MEAYDMQVTIPITLSPRETAFVAALARGCKPTRAATEAGYAVSSARYIVRKPHVEAAVRSCLANLQRVVDRIERGEED